MSNAKTIAMADKIPSDQFSINDDVDIIQNPNAKITEVTMSATPTWLKAPLTDSTADNRFSFRLRMYLVKKCTLSSTIIPKVAEATTDHRHTHLSIKQIPKTKGHNRRKRIS